MDKWQVQDRFWNMFGVPAYEEHSVPDDAPFPRITYEAATAPFERLVSVTASIWTRSTSWATADRLADEIEHYIKHQGQNGTPVCMPIDGGYLRIYIGDTTFAQKMDDPNDDQIKRTLLNVTYEFMTE